MVHELLVVEAAAQVPVARLVGVALQAETDQIVRRIGTTAPACHDMVGVQVVAAPPNRPPAAGGTSPFVALADLSTEPLPARSVSFANGSGGGPRTPGTTGPPAGPTRRRIASDQQVQKADPDQNKQ